MARSIFLSTPLDVLVVSSGGVGTTFLMRAIGKHLRLNDPDNKDGLKHLPIPPLLRIPTPKAIYVFGDPELACLSLFRRQYHHTQSTITQHFYPREYIVPFSDDIEAYLAQPKEGFFFRRHFSNWRNLPTAYPVLFLRYESIHDQLPLIAQYLGLGEAFIADFPPRQARNSTLETLDPLLRTKLSERYGTFRDELKALPDAWVKPAAKAGLPLSKPYRRAYYEALRRQVPTLVNLAKKLRR
ncbi:MAG: hypothetical protein AAF597_02035 [Bacteroidota bacterium]